MFLGNSDGKLDIVVPSFVHYLEVLEGSDGDKMPGTGIYLIFLSDFFCPGLVHLMM